MPIETFHILSESTHNKQQVGMKNISTKERGGSYDATNMCSNFDSKWSGLPLHWIVIQSSPGHLLEHMESYGTKIMTRGPICASYAAWSLFGTNVWAEEAAM